MQMLGASNIQSAGVLTWAEARQQSVTIPTTGATNLCAYSGPGTYLTGEATLTASPIPFTGSAEGFVIDAVLNLPQGAFDLQLTCTFDPAQLRQPAANLPPFIKKLMTRREIKALPRPAPHAAN